MQLKMPYQMTLPKPIIITYKNSAKKQVSKRYHAHQKKPQECRKSAILGALYLTRTRHVDICFVNAP